MYTQEAWEVKQKMNEKSMGFRYRVKIYTFGRKSKDRKVLIDTRVNARNISEAIAKAAKKGKVKGKALATVWRYPHTLMGSFYPVKGREKVRKWR